MKQVSHQWNSLANDQKGIYDEMAREDKVRYDRELEVYNRTKTDEDKPDEPN
jgi:hypothetical protein